MTLLTHRGEPYEYTEVASGLKLFSVTQGRRTAWDAYAHVPADVLEATRRRGKLLHTRFALMLLARAGVCPHPASLVGLEGQCLAMDEWAERNKVRPIRVEEPSLNRQFGFAGQPDTQCLYGARQILTLADLKTGEPVLTDWMQLEAYDHLEGYKSQFRLDLYIHADGTYKEEERKPNPLEWAGFLNALNLLRWRMSHGLGH